MRKLLILIAIAGLSRTACAELSADHILARADAIRAPTGDYEVAVRVVSVKPGGKKEEGTYEVLIKGRDKTLIKTLTPATEHGTSLLMLGHDLWVFLTDVSKPVRISLQQRLLGDVANGDLARANFVGDYTPRILQSTSAFYLLELTAKSDDVTYGRVRLWVDHGSLRPIRAAFYSLSGKLLKVGSYEDYRAMAGEIRPSRLVFTDAIIKGQVSTLNYDRMKPRGDLPEKWFSRDYLKKLKY